MTPEVKSAFELLFGLFALALAAELTLLRYLVIELWSIK